MARTTLTAISWPLSGGSPQYFPTVPITTGSASLAFTAMDATNNNFVAITNAKTMVMVLNADQTATHTMTIHSFPDSFNRLADITSYSVAPSIPGGATGVGVTIASFGPFTSTGWQQTSTPVGLWLDASSTLLQVCVVNNP